MKTKYNTVKLGFIFGIIIPVIALMGFYLIKFSRYSLSDFISYIDSMNIFTQVISFSVVPNLIFSYVLIQKNLIYLARGVIIATFIFTFIILGIEFLG